MIVVLVIDKEVDSLWNVSHPDSLRNEPRIFDCEWDEARAAAIAATEGRDEGHYTEDIIERMVSVGWVMEQTSGDDLVIVHD
jgi:hypothetical protein